VGVAHSPPREEGWLRHQENFGEAYLSAADGVVAHESRFGVSDAYLHEFLDSSLACENLLYADYRRCTTPERFAGFGNCPRAQGNRV